MLKIRAHREGFRRAGKAFSREPKTFADDAFTKDQLEQLEAEPMIEVQRLPDLPEPDKKEEAAARKILEKMKLDELKKECDEIKIEYPDNSTKAVLIDLLIKNTAPEPEA